MYSVSCEERGCEVGCCGRASESTYHFVIFVAELDARVLVQQLFLVQLAPLLQDLDLPRLDLQQEVARVNKRRHVDVLRDVELV